MGSSSPRPRRLAWGLLAGGLAAFLFLVRSALPPFFFAGLLAYFMHPLVRYLGTRSVPRPVAILILYVAFALVLWAAGRLILPPLGREIFELADALPKQTERLEGITRRTVADVRSIELPAARDLMDVFFHRIQRLLESFAGRVADLLMAVAAGVFNVALAPILAFFLLRDWETLRDGLLQSLPAGSRTHVVELARRIDGVVGGYIRGQLLVSLAVGALASAGLLWLKVPYALVVGMLAGLLDIVPYFGPIIGTVPALALALGISPQKALYVLLLFLAIQQVESGILSPKIVGESVGLHPLSVVAAILVGAQWFGVLGMVAAVPVLSALKVVWLYWREVAAGP